MAEGFFLKETVLIVLFCAFPCITEDILDTYRPSRDNPPELNEFLEDVLKYKDEFKWIRLQLDEVADDDNVVDGNAKSKYYDETNEDSISKREYPTYQQDFRGPVNNVDPTMSDNSADPDLLNPEFLEDSSSPQGRKRRGLDLSDFNADDDERLSDVYVLPRSESGLLRPPGDKYHLRRKFYRSRGKRRGAEARRVDKLHRNYDLESPTTVINLKNSYQIVESDILGLKNDELNEKIPSKTHRRGRAMGLNIIDDDNVIQDVKRDDNSNAVLVRFKDDNMRNIQGKATHQRSLRKNDFQKERDEWIETERRMMQKEIDSAINLDTTTENNLYIDLPNEEKLSILKANYRALTEKTIELEKGTPPAKTTAKGNTEKRDIIRAEPNVMDQRINLRMLERTAPEISNDIIEAKNDRSLDNDLRNIEMQASKQVQSNIQISKEKKPDEHVNTLEDVSEPTSAYEQNMLNIYDTSTPTTQSCSKSTVQPSSTTIIAVDSFPVKESPDMIHAPESEADGQILGRNIPKEQPTVDENSAMNRRQSSDIIDDNVDIAPEVRNGADYDDYGGDSYKRKRNIDVSYNERKLLSFTDLLGKKKQNPYEQMFFQRISKARRSEDDNGEEEDPYVGSKVTFPKKKRKEDRYDNNMLVAKSVDEFNAADTDDVKSKTRLGEYEECKTTTRHPKIHNAVTDIQMNDKQYGDKDKQSDEYSKCCTRILNVQSEEDSSNSQNLAASILESVSPMEAIGDVGWESTTEEDELLDSTECVSPNPSSATVSFGQVSQKEVVSEHDSRQINPVTEIVTKGTPRAATSKITEGVVEIVRGEDQNKHADRVYSIEHPKSKIPHRTPKKYYKRVQVKQSPAQTVREISYEYLPSEGFRALHELKKRKHNQRRMMYRNARPFESYRQKNRVANTYAEYPDAVQNEPLTFESRYAENDYDYFYPNDHYVRRKRMKDKGKSALNRDDNGEELKTFDRKTRKGNKSHFKQLISPGGNPSVHGSDEKCLLKPESGMNPNIGERLTNQPKEGMLFDEAQESDSLSGCGQMKQAVSGELATELVDKVFKEMQGHSKLVNSFGSGMCKLPDHYTQMREIQAFGKNATNEEILKTEHTLKEIMQGLNQIISEQVRHRTCQQLAPPLRTYLDRITKPPATVPEINEVAESRPISPAKTRGIQEPMDGEQGNYLFGLGENAGISMKRKIEKKINLIKALLDRYNHMSHTCRTRVVPVKEYLESHLHMLQAMEKKCASAEMDIPFGSQKRRKVNRRKMGNANFFETQTDSVVYVPDQRMINEQVKNMLPFDTSKIVKQAMMRQNTVQPAKIRTNAVPRAKIKQSPIKEKERQAKHRAKKVSKHSRRSVDEDWWDESDKYKRLVETAEDMRRKKETEERIGELFGKHSKRALRNEGVHTIKSKNEIMQDISNADFEAPMVLSLER